jgi:hypothetical protein
VWASPQVEVSGQADGWPSKLATRVDARRPLCIRERIAACWPCALGIRHVPTSVSPSCSTKSL